MTEVFDHLVQLPRAPRRSISKHASHPLAPREARASPLRQDEPNYVQHLLY